MKKFCILLLALLLSAPLCFAQEAEVPGIDELWDQAESYGVEADGGLDQGLSNLFSDALDQIGSLLRTSIATGLKLLAVVETAGTVLALVVALPLVRAVVLMMTEMLK